MHTLIRPIQPPELPFLREFLYYAIYLPPEMPPPPKSVVDLPELKIYTEEFSMHHGDYALVAEKNGQIIGAAWCRIMHDYGHIDDQTPSLAVSLLPAYRGQGVGSRLLRRLLALLREEGFHQVSLSVQKANPATRLYFRLGFHIVEEKDEEYIMALQLIPGPCS